MLKRTNNEIEYDIDEEEILKRINITTLNEREEKLGKNFKICFSEQLGKGGYGYVYKGYNLKTLEPIAIKVNSTDVPLNLKIRDNKKNEAEWTDDGSHLFRIDLKTKNMLRANGSKKGPNWTSQTKKFDFSEGGEVILLPTNGVFKEGKKTVVEYVKVE